MKKLLVFLCAMILTFGTASSVIALTYEDLIDWNDLFEFRNYTGPPVGFKMIDDTNIGAPHPFSFTHNVEFNPPAVSINSATLTLNHWGNLDYEGRWWSNPEVWVLYEEGGTNLGLLEDSGPCIGWVAQDFILPSVLYNTIAGSDWNIEFRLQEETSSFLDWEFLLIDYSKLHGDYAPVPEPATMLLLGSGLIGLAGLGRKKFFKKS